MTSYAGLQKNTMDQLVTTNQNMKKNFFWQNALDRNRTAVPLSAKGRMDNHLRPYHPTGIPSVRCARTWRTVGSGCEGRPLCPHPVQRSTTPAGPERNNDETRQLEPLNPVRFNAKTQKKTEKPGSASVFLSGQRGISRNLSKFVPYFRLMVEN